MFVKILFFLSLCFYQNSIHSLEISIEAKNSAKTNLLIGINESNDILQNIAKDIKADFEFSDQFFVEIRNLNITSKKQIKDLGDEGFSLALFLNLLPGIKNGFEWKLYDTGLAQMIKGEKIIQDKESLSLPHIISNKLWKELTGQEPFFLSLIVACKKMNLKKGKYFNDLYIFHPTEIAQNFEKKISLVKDNLINFFPRWHYKKVLVFYSRHTKNNVQLVCVDKDSRKSIITNFDGLNMTPAYSLSGQTVLSLTRNGKSSLFKYDYDNDIKKGKFTSLIKDNIHAISPSFIDENRIVFCAIKNFRTKIAILNLDSGVIDDITSSGYCVSPCYCPINKKIAYCKKINGNLQIFQCDPETSEHSQLTFDEGDKDNCSWSPCGNYLVFSVGLKTSSRIAILNIQNKRIKFITPASEYWYYPFWSPNYSEISFSF